MEQRILGRTGRHVSVVGLGTWQLGADWGDVQQDDAFAVLEAAYDSGVRFFDTADAYGDGLSERTIGAFLRSHGIEDVVVGTKVGRRVMPQTADIYTLDNLRAWVDRSRANLAVEALDLVQLHCPPTEVYSNDAVFDALDVLVGEGRIAAYGVSVETRAEALAAIARPNLATVQLILNMLRLGPLAEVLPAAQVAGVGIIARVPLASGLLSGRYDENTTFAANDHRTYNRDGSAFDIGETFSGVNFATGLKAVRRIATITPDDATTAQLALRWIIDQPGVTTVIPGARTPKQARGNAAAADLAPLPNEALDVVEAVYRELIAPEIGNRW